MKPKVFIIILNWNQPDLTIECLHSLEKLQTQNFESHIVVVDNGSTDNSIERFKNYDLRIKILENKENIGFAGGNNIGITYALDNDADYIMLLNNDTEAHPNLIDGILKTYNENPKAGAVSPKIYFAKGYEFHKDRYTKEELGKVIWYAGGAMDWNNVYGSNFGVDQVDTGQFDEVKETDFATGCSVMYPSSVLKEVGILDDKYYLYLEDADLSERIKHRGYKIFYTPYGYLWHKVSQSSGIGSKLNDYFITRNRLMFGMHYAPLRAKFALIRESLRFLLSGREWQKKGVIDYYLGKFGRGSWK